MTRRQAAIIGVIALVAAEVAGVMVLVPLTTLTISVAEAYRSVSLGSVVMIATVGAVLAAAAGIGILSVSGAVSVARVLVVAGSVCVVFVIVNVMVGFGYISLYDDDPGNFRSGSDWVMIVNLWGSLLLPAGLVAMAAAYFRRTWSPAADGGGIGPER